MDDWDFWCAIAEGIAAALKLPGGYEATATSHYASGHWTVHVFRRPTGMSRMFFWRIALFTGHISIVYGLTDGIPKCHEYADPRLLDRLQESLDRAILTGEKMAAQNGRGLQTDESIAAGIRGRPARTGE